MSDEDVRRGEDDATAAAVAQLAGSGGPRVLHIGPGEGSVARHLATAGRHVVHLEDHRVVSDAHPDPDRDGWSAELGGEGFDVVVLDGVLERVRDPGHLLSRLLSESLLGPEGIVVMSVPNASHESVLAGLAVGDLERTRPAFLDGEYATWFTIGSLQRLLERSGFLLDRVLRTRVGDPDRAGEGQHGIPGTKRRDLQELNDESDVYHYALRVVADSGAHRMAADRASFEAERRDWVSEREGLRRDLASARAEAQRLSGLLEEERSLFDSELRAGAQELEDRDRRVAQLIQRRDKLLGELRAAREITEQSLYEESRGVRLAARVVRAARRFRAR